MIVPDIATLKKYVIVGKQFNYANVQVHEPDVISRYLIPWMGSALVSQIAGYSAETTDPKKSGFLLLQDAISKLVVHNHLTQGQLIIDDSGVTRVETQETKTAYAGQVKKSQELYEETAFVKINELIDLMNANASDFSQWATAPGKVQIAKLLIKTAAEFHQAEPLHRSNITFMGLLAAMRVCQDLHLLPRFTQTLLQELITGTSLSDLKKQLREHLVMALANFTVAYAMEKNMVVFTNQGMKLIEHDADTSTQIEKTAPLDRIDKAMAIRRDTATRYISLAVELMATNPSEFPGQDTEEFKKSFPWF